MSWTLDRIGNVWSRRVVTPAYEWLYSRYRRRLDIDLSFSEVMSRYHSRSDVYAYMHHCFRYQCPTEITGHREYFRQGNRGFGEDAHYAAWWLLLKEYRPTTCLEIGVYRGQTVCLWALIGDLEGMQLDVHGVSPFDATGDQVSKYRSDIDYLEDTKDNFSHFGLPLPTFVRDLSTGTTAVSHIAGRTWDLVYIDGCHDFDVALSDYQLCKEKLSGHGLLVLDDASAGAWSPPPFAFAGHPGPSKVAAEHAMCEMSFLGAVGHLNFFRRR